MCRVGLAAALGLGFFAGTGCIFLLSGAGAGGCLGPPIAPVASVVDPAYEKTVSRIYILADLPEEGWRAGLYNMPGKSSYNENYQAFKDTLEGLFRKIGVESKCEVRSGIELDESVYLKASQAFKADALFIINCNSALVERGLIVTAQFNCTFVDSATGKRFWRANVSVDTRIVFIGPNPSGSRIAEDIFKSVNDQLKRDKLEIFPVFEPLK
jgi:hypothetical protein